MFFTFLERSPERNIHKSLQVIRSVTTACNARGSQRGLFPPVASLSSRWAEPNPLHEGVLTVRSLFIWRGIKASLRLGEKKLKVGTCVRGGTQNRIQEGISFDLLLDLDLT
ncbi:hypothetical protein BgiBS90_020576 [Biomphalaria glabrata]|nr:hypothetical protein BgiBS90_020576 [Biomphalaria glabrata]